MKIFISADIEGTNGIADWDETFPDKPDYRPFAERMTAEVGAVCAGVNEAAPGCAILVKDAHETGRNIDHAKLPENALLNRGWSGSPLSMMDCLDSSFDAAIFTGYHSPAGTGGSPLAHTMRTRLAWVRINGAPASEFLINYYISMYFGVPLVMVSGDAALCAAVRQTDPNIKTVAAYQGTGMSVTSKHPRLTLQELRETAKAAVLDRKNVKIELPREFKTEIYFKEHSEAYRAAFFPGAHRISDNITGFDTADYMRFLTFLLFV